jgi:hypothetical protein
MDAIDLKKEMKAGRKKAVCALKSFINCKYCPTHYKDNLDLSKHLVLHLKNFLYRTLPETDPFQCPKCSFVAPERITLLCHLGTDHASFVIELTHQPTELLDVDMSFVDPKILSEPEPESANRRAGLQGSLAAQNRRPQIPQPSQRQQEEDKKFPKCRICDYRYYTRLDLCRHFVDFHLRPRLSSCLNPNSSQCPSCQQTFEKQQVLLRHFIWAHQNLEQLVVQDFNLKLSEFMPSAKDLEIVKQKNERKGESDEKDLNDLVPMPLNFFLRH